MATLKAKEIKKMTKQEREKRMEELRMEMIKARVDAAKKGSSRVREIKKIIARILTVERIESGGKK